MLFMKIACFTAFRCITISIMPISRELKNTLDLMIEQELAISELYSAFAEVLPQGREFWQELAADEQKHATWIWRLQKEAQEDLVTFEASSTMLQAVNSSLENIRRTTERTRRNELDTREAFRVAHEIESSMIENQVFKHFCAGSSKMRSVLDKLERVTELHRDKIKDQMPD